jgi:hypothetical protein
MLANDLDALGPQRGGFPHKVDVLLGELPDKDREALERALRDPKRVSERRLAITLRAHDLVVSPSAIRNWRVKERVLT